MVPPSSPNVGPRQPASPSAADAGASSASASTSRPAPGAIAAAVSAAEAAVPAGPVSTPLPLCSAKEVQRLLAAVEAPDYVTRSFRENSITGQDLVDMNSEDLLDQRFKLPQVVIRKVLRIPASWQLMCAFTRKDTCTTVHLADFLRYLDSCGVPAAAMGRVTEVFRASCKSGPSELTFEEFVFASGFLVSVLESALDIRGTPVPPTPAAAADALGKDAHAQGAKPSPRDGLIHILRGFRRHVFQQAMQTPFF